VYNIKKKKKGGGVKGGGPVDQKKKKYKCPGLCYPQWQRVYIRDGEICSMCEV
jgi:hypothetical protein